MRASFFQNRTALKSAWGALGLLLLLSFCLDFVNVQEGGSIDLRNRITGDRLLLAHRDPYFYKWQEPEPAEFCDPYNNPKLPVSKTTATPALLLLHSPLAVLPYRIAQFLWLFLQWLLLLGTVWLWFRLLETDRQRWLLAAFVTGFTYTAAWRLHAERGQSYVLLLFLFAAWLALTLRERHSFWTGMLAGLLAALRPPFLLLAPFLLWHRRRQLPGVCVGLLLGLVLPMLWRGDCWAMYGSAMQTHSALYRTGTDPAPGPEIFPPEIEGTSTDLLANYAVIPYADFSVHAFLRGLGLEPFPAWPPFLAATAAYLIWLWMTRGQPMERLLLGVAGWFFLIDLFLPAYRDSYNDVLIVNIMALALAGSAQLAWGIRLCFLALPAGWAIFYFAPMHDWLIDLPSFFLALGAMLLIFWFNFPGRTRKV